MSGDLKLIPDVPAGSAAPGADSGAGPGAGDAGIGTGAPSAEAPMTPLGALLVERGDMSGQQLRDALGAQTSGGKRLGEILVELGIISERVLSSALAEQVGLEAVDLSRARPDIAIVGLMSRGATRGARRVAAAEGRRPDRDRDRGSPRPRAAGEAHRAACTLPVRLARRAAGRRRRTRSTGRTSTRPRSAAH